MAGQGSGTRDMGGSWPGPPAARSPPRLCLASILFGALPFDAATARPKAPDRQTDRQTDEYLLDSCQPLPACCSLVVPPLRDDPRTYPSRHAGAVFGYEIQELQAVADETRSLNDESRTTVRHCWQQKF